MNPRRQAVGLLFDWKPWAWSTREEFAAQMARSLAARGQRCVIVCPEGLGEFRDRVPAEIVVSPLTYHRADHIPFFRDLRAAVRKFDIGTANVRFYAYHTLVPWMARACGVRHIVFTEANSGTSEVAGVKGALIRARTAIVCHPIGRFIAISEFIKRRLIAVGVDAARIDVVYNGVNTDALEPDANARPVLLDRIGGHSEDILLLTISTLLPWKNTSTLIDATALARKRGVPARLIVAGEGPLRAELEAQAAELGIAPYCHFLGNTFVYDLLRGSDLLVHASIGEAFGNVLAEAMACEVPVIGAQSGAIGEVVEDGITGLMVPPKNAEAFAQAIEKLSADKSLRQKMGAAARRRACEKFSVAASVEGTLRVYEQLWDG